MKRGRSPNREISGRRDLAFQFTDEVLNGAGGLYINDYNSHGVAKRNALAAVVQGLRLESLTLSTLCLFVSIRGSHCMDTAQINTTPVAKRAPRTRPATRPR